MILLDLTVSVTQNCWHASGLLHHGVELALKGQGSGTPNSTSARSNLSKIQQFCIAFKRKLAQIFLSICPAQVYNFCHKFEHAQFPTLASTRAEVHFQIELVSFRQTRMHHLTLEPRLLAGFIQFDFMQNNGPCWLQSVPRSKSEITEIVPPNRPKLNSWCPPKTMIIYPSRPTNEDVTGTRMITPPA